MADDEFQKLSNYRLDEIMDFEAGQKKLESLKRMRARVNWEIEEEHESFYWQLCSLINDWKSRLPDLREIFRREEIDWLLTKCVKIGPTELIKFVIRTGYRDEPDLDEDGKPLLRRNTPVNYAAEHRIRDWVSKVCELFKIYDKFNVNYTSESGFTHFHAACMCGCDDIVKKFLELGQHPNLPMKETDDTPLHLAIHYECAKVVELLMRSGADLNLANSIGKTPLHIICQKNRGDITTAMVKWLFECSNGRYHPVLVNAKDTSGSTPLHLALKIRHAEVVELLLRRGANPNLANNNGSTALHAICKKATNGGDSDELLFDLLKKYWPPHDFDARDRKLGRTPLHCAALYGKIQMIEKLLRNGANPNLVNENGWTVLHYMINREDDCDDDLMEKFFETCGKIDKSVNIEALDLTGMTPLSLALFYDKEIMVKSLLRNGADLNMANPILASPLHVISAREIDDDLVERFFKICEGLQLIKPEIDARGMLAQTPLHLALRYGKEQNARDLLGRGADPNAADDAGWTPLHLIAIRETDDDLAKKFIEMCSDMQHTVQVNISDNGDWTPLRRAVLYGHRKLTQTLLRNGADPNLANRTGSTPLHVICSRDVDDDLLKTFFEVCYDQFKMVHVDAQDEKGRTPLQKAVANLLPNAVDVLLDRWADLSSFVFPTESYFCKRFDKIKSKWDELRLASGILAVVECLNKRGYELERSDVLTIIKLFVKYGLFEKSSDLENCWYDEEEFTSRAKEIIIIPNLSLYDLILLPSEIEDKLLTYTDYFGIERLNNLNKIPEQYRDMCLRHLCEKVSRRYFQRMALEAFQALIHYQLTILCCEKIIENLTNEDLFNIYQAVEIVT